MKKILFLGTHGQKNWGDELLLHVFMHQLKGAAERFYVNSYDPELTAAYLDRQNVTVFHTKADKLKLLDYLWRCDALVFGGGNILKELYTAYGGSKYATLGAIDKITKAARLLGKPIFFSNIGVGPLESEQGRQMSRKIVQRASLTTVRDSESYDILQSLQISTPYKLTSDAVFTAGRTYFGLPEARMERRIDGVASLRTIGINLCRNIANNNNWSYFIDRLTSDILDIHSQNPNLRFVGIPMQFDVESNDDYAALQELADKLQKSAPGLKFEIAKPQSLDELAATIDKLDILIAERLHALILALIAGVPVVALEYDIKVSGVIKDLGLKSYSIDINKKFKQGKIAKIIYQICQEYKDTASVINVAYYTHHEQSNMSFINLKEALA